MAKQTEELDGLKVAELRDKAKEAGVTGASHMRKSELIESLSGETGATAVADSPDGDIIEILIADHAKVRDLFKQALEKEAGDESIEPLAEQIIMELKLHTEAEEQIFYPALKAKAESAEEDDAKEGVIEAYVEHGSVKELIAKIEAIDSSDESYKAILQVISEQVEHHVEEEESEMFRQARELLSDEELSGIGQEVLTFKESAMASVS